MSDHTTLTDAERKSLILAANTRHADEFFGEVERIVAARVAEAREALARVEALADEWWGRATEAAPAPYWRGVTRDLRAALSGPSGTEGQA